MRVIIDGVVFTNPTHLRIEVPAAGETMPPWHVEMVGGPLCIEGTPEHPAALMVDLSQVACGPEGSALTFIGYEGPGTVVMDPTGSAEVVPVPPV